ncbi:hypothetical protein AALP_AA5G241000 [Arabis alpina]|uniref:Uncharacterized protein n=1 Tax=Arabis alpina TaxID=50452 RepID=A0A087GZ27_ARAAL|nr:hypothetical protein AALP_AA5G241000 [Arabis alpina]
MIWCRRCFTKQTCFDDAKLLVVLWAVESMEFHRVNNVVFALQFADLVGAVTRAKAWPSFSFQSETNRGAFLIALSVTKDARLQSYVSAGLPLWLKILFDNERIEVIKFMFSSNFYSCAQKMDRVSSLHDEVLCHILSFLSTKQAAVTSLLPKR